MQVQTFKQVKLMLQTNLANLFVSKDSYDSVYSIKSKDL